MMAKIQSFSSEVWKLQRRELRISRRGRPITQQKLHRRAEVSKSAKGVGKNVNDALLETPPNVTYYTPRTEITTPSVVNLEESDVKSDRIDTSSDIDTYQQFLPQNKDTITASDESEFPVISDVGAEDATIEKEVFKMDFHVAYVDDGSSAAGQFSSNPDMTIPAIQIEQLSPVTNETCLEGGNHITGVDADEATAAEHLATAQRYKENNELDKAAREFLAASDLFENLEHVGSSNSLMAHPGLAETNDAENPLGESARIYRKVIDVQEGILADIESLCSTLAFVRILVEGSEFDEAERVSWKASASFIGVWKEEVGLEFRCLRGEIKRNLGHPDAERYLVEALADSLDRMLLPQITSAVESLLKMAARTQNPVELPSLFAKMLEILENQESTSRKTRSRPSEILFQAVGIASAYSAKQCTDFDYADRLFCSVIVRIKGLSSSKEGDAKAMAYLLMALHHKRQQSWGVCYSHLRMVARNISSRRGKDTPEGRLLDSMEELNAQLWATNGCSSEKLPQLFETKIDELKSMLDVNISAGTVNRPLSPVLTGYGLFRMTLQRENADDIRTYLGNEKSSASLSSRSYRIGVTYSAPSITGINDSISMFM